MELYNREKYSDAYYNFKQIKSYTKIYNLSLIKQIQCAQKLQDKKTARVKLIELTKNTKDKNILPWAQYNEAIISAEIKIDGPEKQYKKFKYIYETYPESDFGIASGYKIAQLQENRDTTFAMAKYVEYLTKAPNGKYAQNAIQALKERDFYLEKKDWEVLARAYLADKKYQEALDAFSGADFSNNWNDIAKCYRGLGDKKQEEKTILKGLNLSSSNVKEKEISSLIDRLIILKNADKIQLLQGLYTKYPNSYITPTVSYKLAESTTSIRSQKLYEHVYIDYPNSIWASNSLWEVFWYNYRELRFQKCETLAKIHRVQYKNTQDAPRVLYWYGKALLHEKKNPQAKDVFYDVIANYPLSYYSFLSARALKMSKAKKMIVKKPVIPYSIDNINKFLFKDKTLLLLAQNNDFETLDELKINDEFIKSWISHKKKNYPQSIKLAKDELYKKISPIKDIDEEEKEQDIKISFSDWELKLIYPVVYEDIINETSLNFKQSPYLFLSLVREESHFDKNARSSAGALGLSQVMNATADFIEKKKVSKDTLLNEKENIRIGLKYFNYLIEYFNNSEYLAILSYNAGPGNITRWLNDSSIASDEIDVFVENIPYLETKNYIKKILSSYWIYLNIYSPKNRTGK